MRKSGRNWERLSSLIGLFYEMRGLILIELAKSSSSKLQLKRTNENRNGGSNDLKSAPTKVYFILMNQIIT